MYCNNCGSEFADGEAFCPECGTAVQPAASVSAGEVEEAVEAPAKGLKDKLPLLAAAAAIVVIALILIISCAGGSAKGALKDYYKALGKGNTKKMILATFPKKVAEELVDEIYDAELKEFYNDTDDLFDVLYKGLKEEGKVKFTYEIKKIENVDKLDKLKSESKSYDIKDLDDFQDYMDDYLDDYDFKAEKIKKAYIAEVKWTISVDGESFDKQDDIVFVYKYKGDWYILGGSDFSSVYRAVRSANNSNDFDGDFDDVLDDVSDAIEDTIWADYYGYSSSY